MNFVYRYVNEDDEIVYVGKTNSMKRRVAEHLTNEHWTKDNNFKIEYIMLCNKTEEQMYESHYISLWQPKFNTDKKNFGSATFNIPEKEWVLYEEDIKEPKEPCKSDDYKKKEKDIFVSNEELDLLIQCFKSSISNFKTGIQLKFNTINEGNCFTSKLSKLGIIKNAYPLFSKCTIHEDGLVDIEFNNYIPNDILVDNIPKKINELKQICRIA